MGFASGGETVEGWPLTPRKDVKSDVTGTDRSLCRWVETSIAAKYNELRHTAPEIQRLPRHSSPGNPAKWNRKYDKVQVRPCNQALSLSCSLSRLRDPGLVRLQGIFTAVEASAATTYGPWRAGACWTYSLSVPIRAHQETHSPGGMILCWAHPPGPWRGITAGVGRKDDFRTSRPSSAAYQIE